MSGGELSLGILVGSISRAAGGLFGSVRHSAIALARSGAKVTVYGLADGHAAEDLIEWTPLLPQVFHVRGPRGFGYAPKLRRSLWAEDHNVLHLHGIWQHLSLQSLKWRRHTGRPLMISPRGMLDPWAVENSRLKKQIALALFEKANLHEATCLHALSLAEAKAFREFGLQNPVAIIPNGVELPNLCRRRDRPTWLPDGRRILLYLGRLHPKKGLRELITAWGHVSREVPSVTKTWRLVIAGWSQNNHKSQLERLVVENHLEDNVIFAGPLYGDDKTAVLSHADAFILPSFSEGLPMGILEAWSYGVPVIMTAQCNIPEGFEIDAANKIDTDPATMAMQLAKALEQPDLATRGKRGRALVEKTFDWSNIAERHLAVYRWMQVGGLPPNCVVFN